MGRRRLDVGGRLRSTAAAFTPGRPGRRANAGAPPSASAGRGSVGPSVWQIRNIEGRVLPAVTVLPYDVAVARVCGEIEAALASRGERLSDADLQVAATAIYHGLELVTGSVRHFAGVPGLRRHPALANTR